MCADFIEQAIPCEYEKRKDWGRTKKTTNGIRSDGWNLSRRKRAVKHGLWKHYKVRLVEPEEKFEIRVDSLRNSGPGCAAFTLVMIADLEAWVRAKIYQYAIHLIGLEIESETSFVLALDCEVELSLNLGFAKIAPRIVDARLQLQEF